jgi:hypothetical protein
MGKSDYCIRLLMAYVFYTPQSPARNSEGGVIQDVIVPITTIITTRIHDYHNAQNSLIITLST